VKISVIIPTYNYGRFIAEAVESVRAQTFTNTEIIVVDDESTDDTLAVLERIKDPRLKVVKLKRSGVGAAQNTGMRMATGKYIAFLDADDRWLPTKLERQLEVMESEPDMVAHFCNFVRSSSSPSWPQFRRSRLSRAGGKSSAMDS
jgi:glycosyltransferase involved in cell wall biosynthesis